MPSRKRGGESAVRGRLKRRHLGCCVLACVCSYVAVDLLVRVTEVYVRELTGMSYSQRIVIFFFFLEKSVN